MKRCTQIKMASMEAAQKAAVVVTEIESLLKQKADLDTCYVRLGGVQDVRVCWMTASDTL
jgi:hypothetical protein